jgi:hypothetical protein
LFLPTLVQQPMPPVWIGGRWPTRRSFPRAARFDGLFPTFTGVGHAKFPTRGRFRRRARGSVRWSDHERVAAYREVGLTCWIEKLGWFRGWVDAMRRRIEQGPPAS